MLRTLIVFIAAFTAPAPVAQAAPAQRITVMTRNLFLGADLIPLATAPAGPPFQLAAGTVFDQVRATDPDARMKLIAAEIAKAKPDLVGLQEVSLWRTGAAPASGVVYDYRDAVMAELKRRHARYVLIPAPLPFNVEAPTDRGFDVRLTLGDAILVRRGVTGTNARSGVFHTQLTIPTQGVGPVPVRRGWTSIDAQVGRARIHFVNTHLEGYSPTVREAQAKETVAGAAKSKRPTVLAGDLNSGPDLTNPGDRLAYAVVAKAGFKPARTSKPSCCFGDLHAGTWDHNVDWILTKPRLKLVRSSLTGDEKTPGGVHPSDHGGVVSTLALR